MPLLSRQLFSTTRKNLLILSDFTTSFSTVTVLFWHFAYKKIAREQDKTYQFLNLPPQEGSREHILWKKENAPEPVPEPESEEPVAEDAENDEEIKEETQGILKVTSNENQCFFEEAGDEADDYEFPGEAKPEEDAAEDESEE